jgi:SAM-dependent methyltransferase
MDELAWMIRKITSSLSPLSRLRKLRADSKAWKRFWREYRQYKAMCPPDRQPTLQNLSPFVYDNSNETPVEPIYFYQDAWAFEKIAHRNVKQHVDIGSHHKFVSLLSKIVPVTMVDIRPLSVPMDTISFRKGSITDLPFEDQSLQSVSSLCVVEHIGLGRYGDPLDPDGTAKAVRELCRVLAPGGYLYVSLPVANQSFVTFNEARILSLKEFHELIQPLRLMEEKYIVDGRLQNQFEARPGLGTTGLFELMRDA